MELDKHAEQEFPVGERVVVTHSTPNDHCRVGEVLTVVTRSFIWWAGAQAHGRDMDGTPQMNGWKMQALKRVDGRTLAAHPVVWLRKYEDPDGEVLTVDEEEAVEA